MEQGIINLLMLIGVVPALAVQVGSRGDRGATGAGGAKGGLSRG